MKKLLMIGLVLGLGGNARAETSGDSHLPPESQSSVIEPGTPSGRPSCFDGKNELQVKFYGWGVTSWTEYTITTKVDPEAGTIQVTSNHGPNVTFSLDTSNHTVKKEENGIFPSLVSGQVSPEKYLELTDGVGVRFTDALLRLRKNDPSYRQKKEKLDCMLATVGEEVSYVRRIYLNLKVSDKK